MPGLSVPLPTRNLGTHLLQNRFHYFRSSRIVKRVERSYPDLTNYHLDYKIGLSFGIFTTIIKLMTVQNFLTFFYWTSTVIDSEKLEQVSSPNCTGIFDFFDGSTLSVRDK